MIFRLLNLLKGKYHLFKIYKRIKKFFYNIDQTTILLFGFQKSGNTWLRLLLYNYRNLLLNPDLNQTITYDVLNVIQNNHLDSGTTFLPRNGFPLFYRTHTSYTNTYDLFDKKIFIHRNPLDTLISSYYFWKYRDTPFLYEPENIRTRLYDIDFYVSYKIKSWIDFYNISIKHADFVLNYTEMKEDPEKSFRDLLCFLNWSIDEDILRKAVDISSFQKIKKMGKEKSQEYGNAPKDGSFKGEFTRSGEEAQFKNELKQETIDLVLDKFPLFNNLYPNLID